MQQALLFCSAIDSSGEFSDRVIGVPLSSITMICDGIDHVGVPSTGFCSSFARTNISQFLGYRELIFQPNMLSGHLVCQGFTDVTFGDGLADSVSVKPTGQSMEVYVLPFNVETSVCASLMSAPVKLVRWLSSAPIRSAMFAIDALKISGGQDGIMKI